MLIKKSKFNQVITLEVYIVTTIESCRGGENFIVENVFDNYVFAAVRVTEINFTRNIEYCKNKDKTELEHEYNALMKKLKEIDWTINKSFDSDEFKKMSANFIKLLDKFNKNCENVWDIPACRSYIATIPFNDFTKFFLYFVFNLLF
jgi:hypothetical protein